MTRLPLNPASPGSVESIADVVLLLTSDLAMRDCSIDQDVLGVPTFFCQGYQERLHSLSRSAYSLPKSIFRWPFYLHLSRRYILLELAFVQRRSRK